MDMKKLWFGIGIVALGFLIGCKYDKEDELYPVLCDQSDITFSRDIEPIIASKCAVPGCHVTGGTANGNFEDYLGLNAKVGNGSVRSRVLESRDMPPSGSITPCELETIQSWLDAGAPNN